MIQNDIKIFGLFIEPNIMYVGSLTGESSIHFMEVLQDLKGFELFMEHLFSEFASENLLCYLELCQFRQMMKKRCENEMNDVKLDDPHGKEYVLSDQLPKSSIVFDNELNERSKICGLINKYIKTSATYEINIPYQMRMNFIAFLKDKGNTSERNTLNMMSSSDLVFLFDPILKEISGLMRSSFSRFTSTAAFHKYIQEKK